MNDKDHIERRGRDFADGHTADPGGAGRNRHQWMMLACCLPMLILAAALVLTGTVTVGALMFAVACVAMMAMMMFSPGGHQP